MAQILRPPIRLSQNEIDNILANEKAKWRNFRIQQVRAQSREEAFRVREAGRKEEKNQIERIKMQENAKWEAGKQRKIQELEKKLQKDLQDIGEGHQRAQIENEALQAHDSRRRNDNKIAAQRGRKAFLALDKEKSLAAERENASVLTRKVVMQKEKKRAAKISKLSTPVKFKALKKAHLKKPPKKVMFHEAGTFTTSSYVPSKVKIIKEGKLDQVSGKESAQRENVKYEEMKSLKTQEEEENRRKIEERGKLAIKREKTKEMYSHLMSQLNEAEENHELSDYLKGGKDFDSTAIETYLKNEREAVAEEKAKKVLAEELDTVPVKLVSDSSKESESSVEKSLNIDIESFSSDKSVSVQDEVDDIQPRVKSLLSQSKDIHFKETVPAHEIPIIREKFVVRVPLSDQSQSTTSHTLEKSQLTSESESSFEKHKIKSKFSSSSEFSPKESRSFGEKAESDSTLYRKLPEKDKSNLISKARLSSEASITPSTSSSGITKYLKPPPTLTDSELALNNEFLWKNIKDIQERNKKFQSILSKLKKDEPEEESLTSTTASKELSSFKTPPNIYTETLKSDGLGSRPVSKRKKFESNKKKILEIYMRRLLQMKEEEIKEISASTVNGSGISLSSSGTNLLEMLQAMNITSSDSSFSTTPTITSNLLNRLSRIGFVPSKISTPILSSLGVTSDDRIPSLGAITSDDTGPSLGAIASDDGLPSLGTSAFSPVQTSNSEDLSPSVVDTDTKKQILLRLIELQKLKQECIKKKSALQNQKTPVMGHHKSTQGSYLLSEKISEASGSSLDWGSNNYETPPREISTQSWSEFSDFPSHQRQQQKDAIDSELKVQKHKEPFRLDEYNGNDESSLDISKAEWRRSHEEYKYVSLDEEIKALVDSAQKLKATVETSKNSNGEHSPASSVPKRDASTSSSSSLPDMDQVIRRIGLGWVKSMATKMDKAEEIRTSDYTE